MFYSISSSHLDSTKRFLCGFRVSESNSRKRAAAICLEANEPGVYQMDAGRFSNPFQFEISYECLIPLENDLEWKLTYVGSAEDEKHDQVLESVLVGPVNVANPADPSKIPEEEIIGVTVLLLTCSYMEQEFIRVGYYVNNDYVDEQLREEPPQKVLLDKIQKETSWLISLGLLSIQLFSILLQMNNLLFHLRVF